MLRPLLFLLALTCTAAHAQHLTAYPNPLTDGPLTVRADAPDAVFELSDVLGRTVDVRQSLAPGTYLWRLRSADGTASPARPLTLARRGPLEVRLVHEATTPPSASASDPRRADLAGPAKQGGGCAPSPGGALFGGAYHAPAPGVVMSGGTTMVVQGPSGASFSTCLPPVPGVGFRFPAGQSPFKGTDEELQVSFTGTLNGDTPASGTFLLERGDSGPSVTFRGGIDASQERVAEVIRYDADGNPSVVSTATIPAGIPLSTPWASASVVVDFRLMATTMLGQPVGASLDTLWRVQFDFRSDGPISFQLPGQAAVQGDAVALMAQIDGLLALDGVSFDASATAFGVDRLGFASWHQTTGTLALAPSLENPAWVRTADPNGLVTADATTGALSVGCGQGASCTGYGAEVSPSFASWEQSTGTLANGPIFQPAAGAIYGGPFSAAPGRGVLLDRFDEIRHDAYYTITLENLRPVLEQRVASITFGKPRLGKTTLRMEEECADELTGTPRLTPCTPTFTQFELRYIRNGRVRLSKVLPADRTITFNARLEILDSESLLDASTPYFRYRISLNGGEESIEVVPQTDPSATSFVYGKITWTYTEPWTMGFGTWSSSTATLTTPLLEGDAAEEWAFEIE